MNKHKKPVVSVMIENSNNKSGVLFKTVKPIMYSPFFV